MCTSSLLVSVSCLARPCNLGEVTVIQVRAGESGSKLRNSSLVPVLRLRTGIWLLLTVRTAHGARVTAHYNTNTTSLDGLIGEFGGDRIKKSQADLGAEKDTIRMFHDINSGRFGPVQVIIVNHAIYVAEDIPLSQMSLGQWDRTLNANLTSSFLVIREYLKGLEDLDGNVIGAMDKVAIVLVGSTAGKYGEPGHADYSVTKSGKLLSSADLWGVLTGVSHDVRSHDDTEE